MSIDPSWISTIYGLLILIGEVLSAMCFAVVVERILVNYKPMSELLRPDYVQDHGKWMLTFIMVWAYFWFSQWLIIWAGNLPDEITWYMRAIERRLGIRWAVPGAVPLRGAISFSAFAPFQARIRRLVWLAVWLHVHALRGFVLDHRAEFFASTFM